MRGAVGQVPAELTPHLAWSCHQLMVKQRVAKMPHVDVILFFSINGKSPVSPWECCPVLRPLSCATSCRVRLRPSP